MVFVKFFIKISTLHKLDFRKRIAGTIFTLIFLQRNTHASNWNNRRTHASLKMFGTTHAFYSFFFLRMCSARTARWRGVGRAALCWNAYRHSRTNKCWRWAKMWAQAAKTDAAGNASVQQTKKIWRYFWIWKFLWRTFSLNWYARLRLYSAASLHCSVSGCRRKSSLLDGKNLRGHLINRHFISIILLIDNLSYWHIQIILNFEMIIVNRLFGHPRHLLRTFHPQQFLSPDIWSPNIWSLDIFPIDF